MTALPRRRRRVGDRAAFSFRQSAGRARRSVPHPGTVTAIAEEGLPPGARLTVGQPGHGPTAGYATHLELGPGSRKRA